MSLKGKLVRTIGRSREKRYRQVKIKQTVGQNETMFVVDIPDEANAGEKMDEIFNSVFQNLRKMKWYEENK